MIAPLYSTSSVLSVALKAKRYYTYPTIKTFHASYHKSEGLITRLLLNEARKTTDDILRPEHMARAVKSYYEVAGKSRGNLVVDAQAVAACAANLATDYNIDRMSRSSAIKSNKDIPDIKPPRFKDKTEAIEWFAKNLKKAVKRPVLANVFWKGVMGLVYAVLVGATAATALAAVPLFSAGAIGIGAVLVATGGVAAAVIAVAGYYTQKKVYENMSERQKAQAVRDIEKMVSEMEADSVLKDSDIKRLAKEALEILEEESGPLNERQADEVRSLMAEVNNRSIDLSKGIDDLIPVMEDVKEIEKETRRNKSYSYSYEY